MARKQCGFTLVEMAIVLVVIGLLLGGVLKGQELIASAKVKSLISDFRTVSVLVYGYQDKYRSFPGDQTQAQLDTTFGSGLGTACTPAAAGLCAPNNGRLDGNWSDNGVTAETFVFWQHVRLANLATGSTNPADAAFAARNAEGGQLGIESGISAAGLAAPMIAGMRGVYFVCSAAIAGRSVRLIDSAMDDGNSAAGSVRAVLMGSARGTAGVATADIVDGQQYLVCVAY